MKANIHPTYYPNAQVTCACGNSFAVGSTMEKIEVEICSACHPFYTGQEKVLDTAGRVEKFKARRQRAEEKKAAAKPKKEKPKKPAAKPKKKASVKDKKTTPKKKPASKK